MNGIGEKPENSKHRFAKEMICKQCAEINAHNASRGNTIESAVVDRSMDIRRRFLFRNEYLVNKYEMLIKKRIRQSKLSPKNIQALDVLDEIMSTPDDMGKEWWDKYFADLDKFRFKI